MSQLLFYVNDMRQDIYKDILPLDTTFTHGGMEMKLTLYIIIHQIISLHELIGYTEYLCKKYNNVLANRM